jgi:mRNA-degrading endonuclease toxin of MazEF toxin-antitoxin module
VEMYIFAMYNLCRFASPDKERPVLLLTRTSSIGHLNAVTVAPIIFTIREVPSEVVLEVEDGMKARCAVNLHNLVTISQNRLERRIGGLSEGRRASAVPLICEWLPTRYQRSLGIQTAERARPKVDPDLSFCE